MKYLYLYEMMDFLLPQTQKNMLLRVLFLIRFDKAFIVKDDSYLD